MEQKTHFAEWWPFPWVVLNRNMFNIQIFCLQPWDEYWNWSLFRVTIPRFLHVVVGGMQFCYKRGELLDNLKDRLRASDSESITECRRPLDTGPPVRPQAMI